MNDSHLPHFVIPSILILIVINLFLLDLKIFSSSSLKLEDITTTATPKPTISSVADLATCPVSCLSLIKEATQDAGRTGTLPSDQYKEIPQKASPAGQKEYYIPLGSGTTSKSDWDNITASETIINPSNYGTIKEAYFVASLRNPTQNGQTEARLVNVTDNYPVWGSHVVMNGPTAQTINSDKIALPSGNKLYRVQLKSTMSYPAYLDNAKIRIITE